MSGRDERKVLDIPNCPMCGRKPGHWILGRLERNPLCWVYSREHSLSVYGVRRGLTISFYKGNSSMSHIEDGLTYAWCPRCNTHFKDRHFLQDLIDVAKRLEKTKYEE